MHLLFLISMWLHILAATAWIGGMFFLVLVVVPWLRSSDGDGAGRFLRETGERFRSVGWGCFAVLATTGTINLWVRGIRLGDFVDPVWLRSPFGATMVAKLSIFALVLLMSAVHDFGVGPRAALAMDAAPGSPEALRLRRQASVMGRLNALFALVIVALAVMLVRGTP